MESSEEVVLIKQIESTDFLEKLIQQINKDATLAGSNFNCDKNVSVKELIEKVYDFIYKLITTEFDIYLSFLYRVDIPEKTLKANEETQPALIAKQVAFMVLKREWQKVWLRNKIQ